MKEHEHVLYGVRNGLEDWQEEILSTNPAKFAAIKLLASRDGFGRFRVATIDLGTPPDFAATVKTKRSKKT